MYAVANPARQTVGQEKIRATQHLLPSSDESIKPQNQDKNVEKKGKTKTIPGNKQPNARKDSCINSNSIGSMQRRAGNLKIKRMHGDSIKTRTQHEEGHSIERVWYIASREPSDTPPDRNSLRICTQRHINYNNTVLSGFPGFFIGTAGAAWEF